ncbi:hypothetical protein COO60DRAFT_1628123 [Scenedesmus sp. NREL 46B-D3]|nr:hypothetical protein COO60DRAFT_1628123 [Scenedesmus sp. NREL 46B-D3]
MTCQLVLAAQSSLPCALTSCGRLLAQTRPRWCMWAGALVARAAAGEDHDACRAAPCGSLCSAGSAALSEVLHCTQHCMLACLLLFIQWWRQHALLDSWRDTQLGWGA